MKPTKEELAKALKRHFAKLGRAGGTKNTPAQNAARKANAAKGAAARRKKPQ